MVLASALYSSGGGGKSILIPNGVPTTAPVTIPIQLIKADNNFSSSGNFNLEDVFTYCNNFTINTSHQMTVTGGALRVIYAAGTVTIGGNGIVAAASGLTNHWPFIQGFTSTGGSSGNAGTGAGAGGGGSGTTGGATYTVGGSGSSGVTGGGGGGASANGGQGIGSGGSGGQGGVAGTSKFVTLIIVANTITITAGIDFAGGAGAVGTASSNSGGGGGGGGCGGNLLLFANTITHSGGTINVSGGNGGNGGNGTGTSNGGAGGGGGHTGLLFMQGTTLSLSGGTRTATAGTGGTAGTGTGASGAGSAGYAQTIRTITGNPF
jgi:hypothetical protein